MLPFGPDSRVVADHVRNMEACAEALVSAVEKHREAVAAGEQDFARLLNVSVFALVWNADLSTLIHDVQYPDPRFGNVGGWRSKFAARLLALTIIEATEALSGLLGRDFRHSASALGGERVLQEFKPIGKALNKFRKEHDARLRQVRNTVIGHRDKDGLAQVSALAALDAAEIGGFGRELMEWTTSLHLYVVEVLTRAAERRAGGQRGAI